MRKKLLLLSDDALSFDSIAPDVFGKKIIMVNVFAVRGSANSWTLIDAALYFSTDRILRWTDEKFGGVRPDSILLTHGHFDHIGALRELAGYWDVPIYAHSLEMPFLNGESSYPAPDPTVDQGAFSWMSPLYPKGPIDVSDRLRSLPADGTVPGLPGWEWIHTPGHTPGHVSFWRESDAVLIAGDAVVTTQQESLLAVATQRLQMSGPPAYFTPDWDTARASVERIAALNPRVLATGHGTPVTGLSAAKVEVLAREFDEIARPQHVPFFEDRKRVIAAGAALALVAAAWGWRRRG